MQDLTWMEQIAFTDSNTVVTAKTKSKHADMHFPLRNSYAFEGYSLTTVDMIPSDSRYSITLNQHRKYPHKSQPSYFLR
jgi:hypothetical protein